MYPPPQTGRVYRPPYPPPQKGPPYPPPYTPWPPCPPPWPPWLPPFPPPWLPPWLPPLFPPWLPPLLSPWLPPWDCWALAVPHDRNTAAPTPATYSTRVTALRAMTDGLLASDSFDLPIRIYSSSLGPWARVRRIT